MKENIDRIKILLHKYYDGNTSIEEENALIKYLSQPNLPDEFNADKELFSSLYIIKSDNLSFNIENEIIETLKLADNSLTKSKKPNIYRLVTLWAAAASVVIIIGLGFILTSKQNDILLTDTFDDPYEAMEETKRVLALFSAKLSMAQTELEPLNKLSMTSKVLEPFDEMSRNFEYLKKIDALNQPLKIPIIKDSPDENRE